MDILNSLIWILPLFTTLFLLISFKSSTKNLPPGPSPLPILGNLLKLLTNTSTPHKSLHHLAKTYGPIMTLKLGFTTTIVVSSSTLAKQVLQKNNPVSSTVFVLDATRANKHDQFSVALLPASSSKWKVLRKIFNRMFGDKMLEAMQAKRFSKVEDLISYVGQCSRDGAAIDIGHIAHDASFDIMSNTIFSMGSRDDERVREVKDMMYCLLEDIGRPNLADCFPFLTRIDPQGIKHRLATSCVRLFKLFDELMDERLKSRKERLNQLGSPHSDLLDVLIDTMEGQLDGITRENVHHLLLDIFGASMDTNAKSIEWVMAELLRNPMILSKAQQELDMAKGKGEVVQESDISKLPYLQAIVKETFRLHPPAPLLLPRKAEEDTEIGGFTVPKDAQVLVNVWAIGHDPDAWTDPTMFSPERFMGSELDMKGQHYELIPFGAGRRICPGMPLALHMVYVMVASLICSFDWKLENTGDLQEDLEMDDKFGITIRKAKPLRAFPISRA